jgi:UDP-2,3-diacylglucosamine pyrophosphatase LpxH
MRRAILISDLHLGIGPPHPVEEFYSDAAFAALLNDSLLNPAHGDELDLVLLGDTFDLWRTALADADYTAAQSSDIPLDYTVADEVRRLERIRQAHPPFFLGLRQFANRPRCRLTLAPGNHDHSLVESDIQAAVREMVSPAVGFATNFDRPDLALYAEHGNQWDENNKYEEFGHFGVDGEAAGYFFVRLFLNRLQTLEPNLADLPRQWTRLWHYLLTVLRTRPSVLARALRFYVQYRRDRRVTARLRVAGVAFAPDASSPEVATDGPDLLAAASTRGDHVFSEDPEMEHALREAYHSSEEVKAVVDAARPAASPPIPPPEAGLSAAAYSFSLLGPELREEDEAGKLFSTSPTGRDRPLEPGTYRFVVFGHTHEKGKVALPNQARYFNTGTWIGRALENWPVLVVEQTAGGARACLGSLTGERIRVDDWVPAARSGG